MDSGSAIEFDHPFKLLSSSDSDTEITSTSHFAAMVRATG